MLPIHPATDAARQGSRQGTGTPGVLVTRSRDWADTGHHPDCACRAVRMMALVCWAEPGSVVLPSPYSHLTRHITKILDLIHESVVIAFIEPDE